MTTSGMDSMVALAARACAGASGIAAKATSQTHNHAPNARFGGCGLERCPNGAGGVTRSSYRPGRATRDSRLGNTEEALPRCGEKPENAKRLKRP
jgi:hypothetical protein